MISEAAQQALSQAEADVKNAKAKFALWTTAEAALAEAQEAAKTGDSAAVLKHAKYASSQAALGIGQLAYPTTELK
jgi:murein lipoprotein